MSHNKIYFWFSTAAGSICLLFSLACASGPGTAQHVSYQTAHEAQWLRPYSAPSVGTSETLLRQQLGLPISVHTSITANGTVDIYDYCVQIREFFHPAGPLRFGFWDNAWHSCFGGWCDSKFPFDERSYFTVILHNRVVVEIRSGRAADVTTAIVAIAQTRSMSTANPPEYPTNHESQVQPTAIQPSPPHSNCHSFTNCMQCASDPGCGWCAGIGQCLYFNGEVCFPRSSWVPVVSWCGRVGTRSLSDWE
jgi:hypothetical protein